MKKNMQSATFVGLALFVVGQGAPERCHAQTEFFTPARASAELENALKSGVIRSRSVVVDFDALGMLRPGDAVSLQLFEDVQLAGTTTKIDHRSPRRYTLFGRSRDHAHGSIVLVVEEDVLVGTINLPGSGRLFKIGGGVGGVHVISEIEASLLPSCSGGLPLPERLRKLATGQRTDGAEANGLTRPSQRSRPMAPVGGTCTEPPPVFDVMIVYTALARQVAGGTAAINAQCQLALDLANAAYLNSQVHARARMVYRGETDYDEYIDYAGGGDWGEHLGRLTDPVDGVMDEVHGLRETYRADLVALLVADPNGCGVAWCVPDAGGGFSATALGCIAGETFTHELGHNQGCAHDRENDGPCEPNPPPCCGAYPYSYGWRFFGNSGPQYRTIMSYPPGSRISRLSNPDVMFDGVPTGVPIGQPDEAHNAQTISLRAPVVEAFRDTVFDVWVDFGYSGPEGGTFDEPYASAGAGIAALAAVDSGAASELPTLWMKTGSSSETGIVPFPMTIRACGGVVTIGQ